MTAAASRPMIESLTLSGPVGPLQAVLESPAVASAVAVICHPHPQYGGTMTNKVVHMMARACNEVGVRALRFNYRGVGSSAGSFDDGNGETDDTLAVLDWARAQWPAEQLWMGGFSFGGGVALRAAAARDVQRLITVAPAIRLIHVGDCVVHCPWLLVQGDRDELVDASDVQRWVSTLPVQPEVALLPGVDHFFHGRLLELRDTIVNWVGRT